MNQDMGAEGLKERLDDFIKLARAGQTVQLQVKVYKSLIKQVEQSESTDDIIVENDMCLLMADFTPIQSAREKPAVVKKVYAICPINEREIDAKTTRNIANERLKMDYARLKEANIRFEEQYF